MPGEAPAESWGTMPVEGLIDLLQSTTTALTRQFGEVALDEAAYHRTFWEHWQKLPSDMTVAAMNRDCELVCRQLREEVILKTSLREGLQAKQTALIAAIAARAA